MTATPLADRDAVLATDLDGTFLGGTEEHRLGLYRLIEDHRDRVGLVFVTGRDPAFIADLCAGGPVPWPDYVVGDVGTTIAEVAPQAAPDDRLRPIPELEADIARRWGDAGARVRAALDGVAGLTLQPTGFRHRVSYDMDPGSFDRDAALAAVEALDLDHLTSADRYFDVLPKGVSKGPSLRRLVAHLGIAEGRVLTAGDTLNDLSMLTCGLKAVAVGGSEPALLARLDGVEPLHRATGVGAAGILEAMDRFGLAPWPREAANAL